MYYLYYYFIVLCLLSGNFNRGLLMERIKNITIISDKVVFVDALTDLFNISENVEVTSLGICDLNFKNLLINRPDLILIDSPTQHEINLDINKELEQIKKTIPVVYVEGEDNNQKVLELNLHKKPIYFPTFLIRIQQQLRDFIEKKNKEVRIGPYLFSYPMKTLMEQGKLVARLTEMETKILNFLHKADGALIKRDVLLREVWGYNSEVMTHTLETHIYRLRKKIEPHSKSQALLISESGGYRLDI